MPFARLYELTVADFKERTRRYGYLATVLFTVFFGYLVITEQYTIQTIGYSCEYTSIWAGTLTAITSTIMFTIVGFYLVKNSITRDRRTNVGQILACTPLSKTSYVLSKFLSNFTVLVSMTLVMIGAAGFLLIFRSGWSQLEFWLLAKPFWFITGPAWVFVAAVAVLFESSRWLRGSVGNILYLFIGEFAIISGIIGLVFIDIAGIGAFEDSLLAAITAEYPDASVGIQSGLAAFGHVERSDLWPTYVWQGLSYTSDYVMGRSIWIGLGLLAIVLSPGLLNRFDPAREKIRRRRKTVRAVMPDQVPVGRHDSISINETPLAHQQFSIRHMIVAELTLALTGRLWFWYVIAIGLIVAQAVAPFEIVRLYLVPAAIVWPLTVWSTMGIKDFMHSTTDLLAISPGYWTRVFPARWVAGVLVAVIMLGPMTTRAALSGEWSYSGALLVAMLFVPTAAYAVGTTTGTRVLFEVSYLAVWYTGAVDHLPQTDFLATTTESISRGVPFGFLIATVVAAGLLVTAARLRATPR